MNDTATLCSTLDYMSPPHPNPVVAFVIGLSIVLLASILNAAGLNLTKLDHVGYHPYTPLMMALSTFIRSVLVSSQSQIVREIGCALYGYLGCFYTCPFTPTTHGFIMLIISTVSLSSLEVL